MTHNKTAYILLLFTVLIATMCFLSIPNEPDYTGYNTQQGTATIRFNVRPTPTQPTTGGGSGSSYNIKQQPPQEEPIQQQETQYATPQEYAYPAPVQARQIQAYAQEPTMQVIQIQHKTALPWRQTILAIIALLTISYLLMRKKTK